MPTTAATPPFKAKFSSPRSTPPPKQTSNREREYLRPYEVETLIQAARKVGRHGNRDAAIILLMFRHGLRTAELVALKWSQVQRDYPDSPYLFVSERRAAMAAATARGIIERAGQLAGIPFPVHPHMLRHACGFYLASKGHDTRAIQAYLGHKNIQHTVRYTELSPGRFKDFWMD